MLIQQEASNDMAWREEAACVTQSSIVFFGFDDAESPADRRMREQKAKLVCASCGVREACLAYALDTKEPYGIWGGLTEVERKVQLRARKARTALTT